MGFARKWQNVRMDDIPGALSLCQGSKTTSLHGAIVDQRIVDMARDDVYRNPVLDFGAGVGRYSVPIAQAGTPVVQYDCQSMLSCALTYKMYKMRSGAAAIHQDVEFDNLLSRVYEVVIAIDVIQYLGNQDRKALLDLVDERCTKSFIAQHPRQHRTKEVAAVIGAGLETLGLYDTLDVPENNESIITVWKDLGEVHA
jgi:2-polyprenyl-3-methyl-5-hydroxy-6-metoxy-1,4-benzoquinol methylase